MRVLDRVLEWAGMGDGEKMQTDRRLFLKGLAATSAGVLVPTAAMFDMGRSLHVDGNFNAFDPDAQRKAVDGFMDIDLEVVGRTQIMGDSHFGVGDMIQVSGTGNRNDGKYRVVLTVGMGDYFVVETAR